MIDQVPGVEQTDPLQINYAQQRFQEYSIIEQLARLTDDINAGLFGEAAKGGSYMTMINGIKAKYPKR
jgi:hypothetical protein